MKTQTATINDELRHKLVNLNYNNERYDIRHYHGLTFDNLQTLIREGYADPSETQNDSPSISEISDFLKANPTFTAHGYIVTPNREDARVSIEGVESYRQPSTESLNEFVEMFRHADEFQVKPPRCWYDVEATPQI